MAKLNETAIRAAIKRAVESGKRLEVADTDLKGLRLRVTPRSTGSASWILGCRDRDGRARRYSLGRFPEMGVADAREAAREMRVQVKKGADPILDGRVRRSATKSASAGIGTLGSRLTTTR